MPVLVDEVGKSLSGASGPACATDVLEKDGFRVQRK